jgi:hypothetical protein
VKLFFRILASLCLLAPLVSGVSPASAQSVSTDACTEIFSITATNLSGVAVAGEPLSVEVAALQDGWEQWYSLDHATPSAGVLNLCAMTNAQLDTAQDDYGDEFDSQFEAGDKVSISYLPQGSSVTQIYRHVLTAAQADAANAKTVATLPNLVVTLATQVPVSIKDSTGAIQSNAPWEIYEEIKHVEGGSTWFEQQYISYGDADANGVVQVAGLSNGTYQLHAHPGATPSENAMRTKASFTMSGGVATFDSPSVVSGVLTLSNANVKFRLVDQNLSPFNEQTLNEMFPSLNEEDFDWDTISRRSDGYYVANLPDKDSYAIDVSAGGESGYVRTAFTIEVASGVATYKKGSTTLSANSLGMDKANVAFKATDIAGGAVAWPSINVFSAATCTTEASITSSSACDNNSKYLDATRNGFATAKLNDGTYWVSIDLWNAGYESKGSLSKFTVTNGVFSSPSGFATRVAASDNAAILGLDTLVLSARAANFKANVVSESGVVITGGWINASPVCNSNCQWRQFEDAYGDIDSLGRMGLYLQPAPSGTTKVYNVQVEPSQRYSSQASRISFTATVNDLGVVTEVSPPSHLPDYVTSPANGLWTLKLPTPNLSGSVLMPTGSDVAPYSSFDIQKMVQGEYTHTNDIPWMYADDDGRFSGYFSPGRYLVSVNPPYELSNVAEKNYEIVIATDGGACLFDGTNSTTCATVVTPGSFNLRLASPNVTGLVTKGGVALTRSISQDASVELRKWDSRYSYWDWEKWSQVTGDGTYSFNVQSAGVYQIVVNPGYVEGYSSGYQYLVVDDSPSGLTFCKIPEPGLDTLSNATCGGNTAVVGPLTANIALERSNFQINATVPSGFEGWVNASISKLFELNDELTGSVNFRGNYMHAGHLDLRETGSSQVYSGFSSLSDNNDNPAKYRIDVYSYASNDSLPLADQKIFVWAYNFDLNDSEIELCPEASYVEINQTCAAGVLLDSSRALNISLNSGNLSGAVKTPTGDAVPYADLQIQKWERYSSSSTEYSWRWKELYANANEDGYFALNIEDPGYYKVQARQGWGGTLPFADSFTLVKVGASGNWCVLSGEIASSGNNSAPVVNTTCTLGRDNAPSDQVTGLSLQLKNPKISGTMQLVSGAAAVNSHISIRKWNPTYSYYEHVDQVWTNAEGKFFINPSDGDYKLEFYPGWENRGTEIGYEKNLCVGASAPISRPSSPQICSATHILNEKFLGPNLKGIVCPAGTLANNCTEAGVRYSWIEVREKGTSNSNEPNQWGWLNGTSTDSDGRYALRLAEGTNANPKLYSLRVHPSDWHAEDQGIGKRVIFSIGGSVCKIGASIESLQVVNCLSTRIGLLSPNVSGTLTFSDTNAPVNSQKKLMKYSWVSIFTENYLSYVSSANTNSVGKFAANLEDGTYFLDSYANTNVAARSSLRLTLKVETVSGVTGITWKYRNQDNSSYVSTPIEADFDFVPPNVKINLHAEMTKSHIILIKDLDPNQSTREQPRRFVSNGTLASGVLTQGKNYSIKVVPNYEEVLTGTCEFSPVLVTVAEGATVNGVAQANTFTNLTSCRPQ